MKCATHDCPLVYSAPLRGLMCPKDGRLVVPDLVLLAMRSYG